MPADITGTNILIEEDGQRVFRFQPGPIFANLVLADEINRATPKTQSSLLEAMQEHQVTVARAALPARAAVLRPRDPEPARDGGHLSPPRGAARPLPVQGHGPVPVRGGPGRDHGPDDRRRDAVGAARSRTAAEIVEMQRLARSVPIAPHVTAYAVSVLAATHPDSRRAPGLVREYVRYGGSPRGAQALVHGGQDPRPARRPLQRLDRRHPGGRAAGAAPPRDPQLRGRGRGHHHRGGRPRGPRRRRRPDRRVATRHDRADEPRRRGLAADGTTSRRRPGRVRRSCPARSTRPSSTRRSCASSSA